MSLSRDPTLTQRATRAAWWSAVEIVARYGTHFIVVMVLARVLRPADFGLLAMLLVFTAFSALLVDGGLGAALVQKQQTSADEEASVFVASFSMGCALAVLLWLLAPAIARFYAEPILVPLLRVLLWVIPLGALSVVPSALLSRQLNFRTRAIAELIASLFSAVLALWLASQGQGVWSLVWQAVVWAGLRALLLWLLSGWRLRGRFVWRAFSGLIAFGGFLLLASVINVLAVRVQSLLIGRLFDARSLGFYYIAQDTQQAPTQLASSLLSRVGLPMFSVVAAQPAKLAGALRLSLRLSMFVFAPVMLGTAIMAEPIVIVVYGRGWEPAAPLLGILALAGVFWPLYALNLVALSASGRSDLVLKLEIIKALVLIPLVVVASRLSVEAVAWAVFTSSIASVVINTWYSRRLLGCGLGLQLREIAPVIALAAVAVASAWLVSRLTEGSAAALAVAVPAAIAVYIAGAAAFRVQAWHDFVGFLRALLARADGDVENKEV